MTESVSPDGDLVRQVLGGSQDAFRTLVRNHQAAIQAFLGRFVRNLDVVEDLAQESFIKAFRNLREYRGESSFRVWLFGIARNEALMHLRQERARRGQDPGWTSFLEKWALDRLENEESASDLMERRMSALNRCLNGLPPHSAALIEAYYVKGHEGRRIARETGKSEVSVRVTILRIREALRECMKKRLAAASVDA